MTLRVLSIAYSLAAVGPQAVGGAEQVLSLLDRALVQAGAHSVVVACAGSRVHGTLCETPAPRGPLDGAARATAVEAHRRAVARALERWPVDVVHLHGVDFYEYLPLLGASGPPALVTLHLAAPAYLPQTLVRRDATTFFHCVSESQRRDCAATAPALSLLPTIPNGVSLDAFRPTARHGDHVVALGRICAEKGYHLALDAARRADAPMLLAGQVFAYPEHANYFAEQIRPRLDARRRFVGKVAGERKRRFLAGARALLVPSLCAETSSLVAMEALACGTPVIAFPTGALPEIVEHGVTGFLVRDVAEMAEAIELSRGLDRRACRAAARERFSDEITARTYLACYEALAARSASVAPPALHRAS